jgi:hypothetical protein
MTLQSASQLSKKPETNEMRKTILRRLDVLEKEERSREQEEQAPLQMALAWIWVVVLGYYLGDLKPYEEYPAKPHAALLNSLEASARALNYPSSVAVCNALIRRDFSEICDRYFDAYRQLFAKVGLDFDRAELGVLFDAFVTMVNQLPEQWLNWLKATLKEYCPSVEIGAVSNIPRELSGGNFLLCVQDSS